MANELFYSVDVNYNKDINYKIGTIIQTKQLPY